MPAVAQAYSNRVLATEAWIPSNQKRDRREAETLCVMLDKLAFGKFRVMDACMLFVGFVGDFFLAVGFILGGYGRFFMVFVGIRGSSIRLVPFAS